MLEPKAYQVIFTNEYYSFGEIDYDIYPLGAKSKAAPLIFFSDFVVHHLDFDMEDFAKRFRGVILSDKIGGDRLSPLQIYDLSRELDRSWGDQEKRHGSDWNQDLSDFLKIIRSLKQAYEDVCLKQGIAIVDTVPDPLTFRVLSGEKPVGPV